MTSTNIQHPQHPQQLHSSTNLHPATIARCDHFGNLQPSLGTNTSLDPPDSSWLKNRAFSCPENNETWLKHAETWIKLSCLYHVEHTGVHINSYYIYVRLGDLVLAKHQRDHLSTSLLCMIHANVWTVMDSRCPRSSALGSRIADPCWRHRSRFGRWRWQFSPPWWVFFFSPAEDAFNSTHIAGTLNSWSK